MAMTLVAAPQKNQRESGSEKKIGGKKWPSAL